MDTESYVSRTSFSSKRQSAAQRGPGLEDKVDRLEKMVSFLMQENKKMAEDRNRGQDTVMDEVKGQIKHLYKPLNSMQYIEILGNQKVEEMAKEPHEKHCSMVNIVEDINKSVISEIMKADRTADTAHQTLSRSYAFWNKDVAAMAILSR